MKTSFLRIPTFILSCFVLLTACNKETFIESIGKVDMESGDNSEVGYFIFTSRSTVASCGKITIWIDDKIAGYLTADYSGSVTSCTTPPVEGKLIKIVAPVGNHKVTVTVANDCRKYNTETYYLKEGVCRYYGFN